ncbi:MAG: hypothetical protein EHM43_08785 [Ignavibacteriae bacterium]|nr:MAG: hypothetical protein EHM43_08785 [Ignavibacteriota bacterium]
MSEPTQQHSRFEMIATVLMAVATIATAWCAYQSTVWSGVQEFALHDAETMNRQVGTLRTLALQRSMVDLGLYQSFLNARFDNKETLAQFYRDRFPPRFKVPFEKWYAQDPFNNPNAPSHPFVMKEYVVPENVEADSLHTKAMENLATAQDSNAHSEHYILLTVIFASVLFFGGITSNIQDLRTKKFLVVVSMILLAASCIWMLTFPMMLR